MAETNERKPKRRSKRVMSVLGELQRGDRIMVSFHKEREGHERPVYSLVNHGGEVLERNFKALEGLLRPCGDQLFPDGTSQTYELIP